MTKQDNERNIEDLYKGYIRYLQRYYIKKQHMTSEEALVKAKASWLIYYKDNKKRIHQERREKIKRFKESLEKDFWFLDED